MSFRLNNQTTLCPNCNAEIRIHSPKLGKPVVCPECDTLSEIVSLAPIALGWSLDEQWVISPSVGK